MDCLKFYVEDTQGAWEEYLHLVQAGLNDTVNTTIGKTPWEIVYGFPFLRPDFPLQDEVPVVANVAKTLEERLSGVQEHIAKCSLGRRNLIGRFPAIIEDDDQSNSDGWADVPTVSRPSHSEKSLQYHLIESAVGSMDDHLVEFSDALRTVARTLRVVAEGKAHALEEAAEWKRKYELERLRNLRLNSSNLSLSQGSTVPVGNGNTREATPTKVPNVGMKEVNTKLTSSKALFALSWNSTAEKSRYHKHDVVSFESGNIITAGRTSKQIVLEWETPPRSVFILTKPNSNSVQVLYKEMVRWLKEEENAIIFVEPRVKKELEAEESYVSYVQTWETDDEVAQLHKKVDLVITLGGDGTVLWAASLFKGPVPPMVSFAMGSLGFMTPFQSEHYKECIQSVMKGPMHITLRHRLKCIINRAPENEGELQSPHISSEEFYLVLNEVSIDRGISPFLTYLECYCDNFFVTCVQGDGLILSTTSGSTAYSLAAGGSMVDPQVPGILFTPICPHSLSFRPLILPEHVTIRVQIPLTSRGQAWASFDGKERIQLLPGDALLCCMSQWPVPTASHGESTHNFLASVQEGLHWNLRKPQSSDGPPLDASF